MRTISLTTLFLLSSLVSARAVSPAEVIAKLARLKRKTDDDPLKIDGVDIVFSGCNEINPRTKNKMHKDIINAWDDTIDMANAVTEIDTGTDIGSFDYFGPNMPTDGMGDKILNVYESLGSFGRNFVGGWRVNAFCPSEDKKLWNMCKDGGTAFQWDTLCYNGRCPCESRDANGRCNNKGKNGIVNDPKNSYINIQFCDRFFQKPSLKEIIDSGKKQPKEKKYNMNFYWDNRCKILFHEILHGSTVGEHANDKFPITDLQIKIRRHDKPTEAIRVGAYGPLNSKMLARTIRNENFRHVRQNDDNWTGYALAKHIQKEVGVYPILPLADDHVYDDNAKALPNALFLTKGDTTLINNEIYANDTLYKPEDYVSNPGVVEEVVQDTTFRPASDYPKWYIERLQKARKGDLEDTTEETKDPKKPAKPPKPSKMLQLVWEVEPGRPRPQSRGPPLPPGPEKFWWAFYLGKPPNGIDPCNSDPLDTNFSAPKGKDAPALLEGEWEFDIPDMGKCKFRGMGKENE